MELNDRIYSFFKNKAQEVTVECLTVGLGYTAVTTSDGGIGLAYTYFLTKESCGFVSGYYDYEGKPALELLGKIKSPIPLERSMALALVNALNYQYALSLPTDKGDPALWDMLHIGEKTRVAMVGDFTPVAKVLKEKGAVLEVIDIAKRIGEKETFYDKLGNWAEVMILTSTSILNNTTEDVLRNVGKEVKTVMLGPSTPMIGEIVAHLPVHILAGMVPLDREKVLKAVRHGAGTMVIQKFSRKSYLSLL